MNSPATPETRVREILHTIVWTMTTRLEDPACDVRTIAQQLRQIAELALAELDDTAAEIAEVTS